MKRLLFISLLAALALPAAAFAKGPSAATIAGPGLEGRLAVPGQGEGDDQTPLGALVSYGGFFPEVFGQSPDPTRRTRPKGDLGPAYTVAYTVPGPNGDSMIVQTIYPYARSGPVTHLAAGQRFWGDQRTYGGWVVAPVQVKEALIRAGMPATAPDGSGGGLGTGAIGGLAAALAAVLVLAFAALRRRRHRPRPATV